MSYSENPFLPQMLSPAAYEMGSSVTVVQSFSYDSMGRPLTSTHKVGSGSQRIVSSKVYDALGRLVLENRTGLASLKETRSYNVRSWLTGISGTNFSESLKYENSSSPQWGGNISVMEWGTSSLQKCYQFGYDALSRLVSAVYSEGLSAGSCSETYSYDRNGNMMSSVRNGETVALTMSGNRITSAGGTSFVYDSKGRETSGGYGTVRSTQYNLLDLPQRHTIGGGITTVDYSYGADGRKVQEKVTSGTSVTTRDYVGEFLYEGGILKRIFFDGGYVDMTALNPVYVFFLRDHLGSVRSVVTENGSVYQTNDYYPFGDLFSISGGGAVLDRSGNRFRFSGKELSAETGLYDFSARFLHTRFGRFTAMDPLAEKYPGISPYSYCKGNPVRYIDLTGKSYGDYYSQDGRFITSDGIDDDKIYLVHQSNVELYDQIMIKTNDRSMAIRALRKNSEEIGGLIIQNRKEDSSEYTMSKFTALGKDMTISGYIIEPAGPSTPTANQNRRVPEGLYYLDNYSSSNYPSHFVLYNGLVPKSRAILYHVGNTFEDTRGCMLPGSTYDGSGYVGNSRDKVIELFDFIKTIGPDNIRVIINNYIDR